MLAQTLDGEEYEWRISEKIAKGNRRTTSKGHALAKKLITELYPCCRFYEEVPVILQINGRQKTEVYLDFFIPSLSTAIEIQGQQHYQYNSFFYKSKLDFLKAQQRDRNKAEWCRLNGFKLITLSYAETEEQWKTLLMTN